MSFEHLVAMEITADQARAAVEFLRDYGQLCLSELDQPADRASSQGDASLTSEDRAWTIRVDAASSFREAGQWALCYDPALGRELLDRAGRIFSELGHPFGAYLRVVSDLPSHQPSIRELGRDLQAVAYLNGLSDAPRDVAIAPPLRHPQQQAYLVLACAGSPIASRELSGRLRDVLTNSPHQRGVVPVGALGMPIRQYWEMARALMDDAASRFPTVGDAGPAGMADHVQAMASRYAESVDLAMTNSHLWNHAAAPVDVGDIDVVGVTTLAARRFGFPEMRGILRERVSGMHRWARMLVEIALDFAESDADRTDR